MSFGGHLGCATAVKLCPDLANVLSKTFGHTMALITIVLQPLARSPMDLQQAWQAPRLLAAWRGATCPTRCVCILHHTPVLLHSRPDS